MEPRPVNLEPPAPGTEGPNRDAERRKRPDSLHAVSDYRARVAWINQLARDALRSHERRDLELELVYAVDAAQRVREMVQREQGCCAFLSFDLDERSGEIQLTIRVPERAREAADMLLGQFLTSAEARASCGCC